MEASPVNTAMALTPSGKFFALNEGGAPFELELDWDGAIQHLVGFETKSSKSGQIDLFSYYNMFSY